MNLNLNRTNLNDCSLRSAASVALREYIAMTNGDAPLCLKGSVCDMCC